MSPKPCPHTVWQNSCFRPGSNRRPCACEAHVITTTLRKQTPRSNFNKHTRWKNNWSQGGLSTPSAIGEVLGSCPARLAQGGLVAQWITRLTTDQKIAGSNPAEIGNFLNLSPNLQDKVSTTIRGGKRLRPRVGSNHQPFG